MPLSDLAIRTLRPRERAYKVYDRDGLLLLVNPGGSKLWRWRYRFDQKEKLMALGEYPVVTLGKLATVTSQHAKSSQGGSDPMAERKATAQAKQKEIEARERESESSFEKVARKWWDWWVVGKSQRHADYVLRRLEADVFPAFGHKFIDAVAAADIRNLMLAIEGRGARDVAKRAHETTGQIFR